MIPIILAIGLVGNAFGLIILTHRKTSKMGPINMYKFLFVTDTIFLILVVENYLQYGFQSNIAVLSKYVCKLFWYVNYTLAPISPMLLVYISVEKVISIKHPAKKYILRSNKTQLAFFLCVLAYNAVFYVPTAYYFTVTTTTSKTNETIKLCEFNSDHNRRLINFLDIANRVIVPFILKSACSIILMISIHRMRSQIPENFRTNNYKSLKKEINLLLNLIFLNLFYILLSLPFGVVTYYTFNSFEFMVVLYLFNAAYAFNFYIILASNSSFRNEFLIMLHFRKLKPNSRLKKNTEINLRF